MTGEYDAVSNILQHSSSFFYSNCQHFRPKFLQYDYMYDYRHNYYGDVIDYLDKKDRGITAEIPRPQTWAERVLRTVKEWARCTQSDRYQ